MPLRSRLAALIGVLLAAGGTAAQPLAIAPQIRFTHLSVEEGLAQSVVRAVLQDRQGFIWIGTQDGLDQYDGDRLTLFKHDPQNTNSLPHSLVSSLAETSGPGGATLWIGTIRGVSALDLAHLRFTNFAHDPARPASLGNNSVQTVFVDRDGVVWVGTAGGLDRFEPSSGTFAHFRHDRADSNSLVDDYVTSIAQDRDGSLWIGTLHGLDRLDRSRRRFTHFVHGADPRSLANDYVRSLLVDGRGRVWVGTDAGGLELFEATSGGFIHHAHSADPTSIAGNSINSIVEDRRGDIWVGVWGGGVNRLVCKAESEGGRPDAAFVAYRHQPVDPGSLAVDDVDVLTVDRGGVVWVGTYGSGLDRFDPGSVAMFPRYSHVFSDPHSLHDNRVYAILVDRRRTLWVGTWGGLDELKDGAGAFEHYAHDPADPRSLSANRITSLDEDPDGGLWVGTLDGGVDYLPPGGGAFVHYRHRDDDAGSLSSDRVTSVYVDRAGTLWVGTLVNGLNRFDRRTKTFTKFEPDPHNPATLREPRVEALYEDASGSLWIGTGSGLDVIYAADRESGRVTRVAIPGPDGPLVAGVVSFAAGADNTLWVGTRDSGVVEIDRGNDGRPVSFQRYRQRDGLANDRVYSTLVDGSGRLWISTDNGLSRFNPSTRTFARFGIGHGLQANEFRSGGFFDRPSGRMFFGGINGFNAFRPADVTLDRDAPPVVLTAFTILNRDVPIGGPAPLQTRIADASAVTLRHGDSVFSLEFAALEFADPASIRYAYRLDGFDRDWNYTTAARRFATYTNLGPGHYVFRVKASNRDGVWSGAPIALRITIPPPFWMTWWFRTGAGLAILFAFVAVERRRVARAERQRRALESQVATRTAELRHAREQAEQASAAKTMFLANISHEIRTPLNAIVGTAELLNEAPLSPEQREYANALAAAGTALAELIDDTLDLSKIEVGRYELEPVAFDLPRLVAETLDTVRTRALQRGLDLTGTVAAGLPSRVTGDPRALRRVLINLLGNAIKFTDEGRVTLRVEPAADGRIQFAVIDTGIGVAPEKQAVIFEAFAQGEAAVDRGGTGLGLAICRELVALMGGEIAVASAPSMGSAFSFAIPLPAASGEPADGGSAGAEASAARDEAQPPARALRVLLAEDTPHNRMLLVAFLKNTPHRVDIAENGRRAIERFRSARYDLVLMDVNMPDLDGYAATRAIREWEAAHGLARTPIVALTAYALAENADDSRNAGCDEHLTKPLKKPVLLDLLRRYALRPPRGGRVVVPVAADLATLVPPYLSDARARLTAATAALADGDLEPLRELGHNLKGNGASFGFVEITDLGARLESLAAAGSAPGAAACAAELAAYLDALDVVYE